MNSNKRADNRISTIKEISEMLMFFVRNNLYAVCFFSKIVDYAEEKMLPFSDFLSNVDLDWSC